MTKKTLLTLLLSIVLSFAIFGNGIRAEYTYDDAPGVGTRLDLKDPRKIFALFVSPYYFQQPEIGLYRPLPMVTYLINFSLFGTSPSSFHIVNILLHAISSFLVFKLIKFLTDNFKLAFITFLFFLTHPIHTEAVTLIVGRAEILAFLFSLLLIYFHLKKRYLLAGLSFLAALFSKEIALMSIPLLFYTQWVTEKKFPKLLNYLFYVLPLAIYLLLRYIALGQYIFQSKALDFVENPLAFVSLPERIFTAFKVLYLYIEKLIYPVYLTNDYAYDVIKIVKNPLTSPETMLGVLLFILMIVLILHPKSRRTPLGLGAAIFLFPYLLVSNFGLTIGTIMGERLIYFSSLGFLLIISFLILKLKEYKLWPEVPWIIICILLIFYSGRTILRNEDWLNNDKLYAVNLKYHPEGFLTQLYWGTALLGKDAVEEAKKHLAEAEGIYPSNPKLITTLGALAEHEGKDDLAEKYYKTAIQKYNLAIEAYSNLGYLYFHQQKYDLAAENFLKSIELYPAPTSISYYARTQIQLNTPEKGIQVIHKYFGYNPEEIEVVTALGYSYYLKADYKNALTYLTKSVNLGNLNAEIENMIATCKEMLKT